MEDLKIVAGQPLHLEAEVIGVPSPEVKWFKDGAPLRPASVINFINHPTGIVGLIIENARPEDAGLYTCTVVNKLGEVEGKARVDVQPREKKPQFVAELQDGSAIEGFPVRMEVKVNGQPNPTVKWTHNGEEIKPGGDHFKIIEQPDGTVGLLIDKALPSDAGKYEVIAHNDQGTTASKADLIVSPKIDQSKPEEAPRFLKNLLDASADEGKDLVISAPFLGNPIPDVAWTKDGEPLSPSERVMMTCDGKRVGLVISPAETTDSAIYKCHLSNVLGEDGSDCKGSVRKVYQKPSFTQKLSDLQQLPQHDAKLVVRVTGLPPPELTWYRNDVPLKEGEKIKFKVSFFLEPLVDFFIHFFYVFSVMVKLLN